MTEEGVGRLLTVDEAAERIGCHPETIRRWIRAGYLHAVKPGGDKLGYRILESDVEQLLKVAA